MQYGRRTRAGTWSGKGAPGSNGQVRIRPFGRHQGKGGFGGGDAWKIYNNTLVFGADANGWGAGHTRPYCDAAVHEVYNNVFVQIEDHWVAREAIAKGGRQIYDGNLYYRRVANPSSPLFRHYEGSGGGDFARLAQFQGSSFQEATRDFFPPGWEARSVEADPGLDAEYRPSPKGPAASGAIPLPAGFPGGDGAGYRGALAPARAESSGRSSRPDGER
jgi:hypothetical protein